MLAEPAGAVGLRPCSPAGAMLIVGDKQMPERQGRWSWSQRLSGGGVVAALLVRPGHSIAITFPKPEGWTGERSEDQDFIRAILTSAAAEQWSAGASLP